MRRFSHCRRKRKKLLLLQDLGASEASEDLISLSPFVKCIRSQFSLVIRTPRCAVQGSRSFAKHLLVSCMEIPGLLSNYSGEPLVTPDPRNLTVLTQGILSRSLTVCYDAPTAPSTIQLEFWLIKLSLLPYRVRLWRRDTSIDT
ncbi:hypothetical protein VNO77_37626 [Canavalia gladiata]|uniref:Uncharacterized protein n=1 Tax=Canavalia gladiata TaxID=3824 RepID=A0AAN9PX80_CANGL